MSIISEELQVRANQALLEMLSGIEKAADFTVEQAPMVVQELLLWNFTTSLVTSIFGWVLFITASLILSKTLIAYKNNKEWTLDKNYSYRETSHLAIVLVVGSGVFIGLYLAIAALVYSTGDGLNWLKISIAPRVWLLEYAADLVK